MRQQARDEAEAVAPAMRASVASWPMATSIGSQTASTAAQGTQSSNIVSRPARSQSP